MFAIWFLIQKSTLGKPQKEIPPLMARPYLPPLELNDIGTFFSLQKSFLPISGGTFFAASLMQCKVNTDKFYSNLVSIRSKMKLTNIYVF